MRIVLVLALLTLLTPVVHGKEKNNNRKDPYHPDVGSGVTVNVSGNYNNTAVLSVTQFNFTYYVTPRHGCNGGAVQGPPSQYAFTHQVFHGVNGERHLNTSGGESSGCGLGVGNVYFAPQQVQSAPATTAPADNGKAKSGGRKGARNGPSLEAPEGRILFAGVGGGSLALVFWAFRRRRRQKLPARPNPEEWEHDFGR